jgi:23S rRNA (adenine2503-C2)-methyltransferase
MPGPQTILSLSKPDLLEIFKTLDEPSYRADQLWNWLYVKRVKSFDEMKNLSVPLRKHLSENFILNPVTIAGIEGDAGATRKLLAALPDGEQVEEVLIPARDRRTVCVSSQAGCKYHCSFCASGQAGFTRHLETGEIIGQVLAAAEAYGDKPTHVVFMGIGEPLDNYDAVLKAVRIINDGEGLAIGARRITISTCGVVPGIERLAGEGIQFELSVSLHAPNNELRSRLMPVNRTYPLESLIAACKQYTALTNRIITFEYSLIGKVNDTQSAARELIGLLASFQCRVNLIPLSAIEEFSAQPSTPENMEEFAAILRKAGINCTVRASKGSTLKAACGQLRYRKGQVRSVGF